MEKSHSFVKNLALECTQVFKSDSISEDKVTWPHTTAGKAGKQVSICSSGTTYPYSLLFHRRDTFFSSR